MNVRSLSNNMRLHWLQPLALFIVSCATVVAAPELERLQMKRQVSPRDSECVHRFVDDPRDHQKVRFNGCSSVGEFLDRSVSTSIGVSVKLKKPFGDATRATPIEAGLASDELQNGPLLSRDRPIYVLYASLDLARLFCVAELETVEQLTVEYACGVPLPINTQWP